MKIRNNTGIPTRQISLSFVFLTLAAVIIGIPLFITGVSAKRNSTATNATSDKRVFHLKTVAPIELSKLGSPKRLLKSLMNDTIDPQRGAALEKLATKRRGGSPFAIQEIEILDAFEAKLAIDLIEADIVISRALYDVYVAGKTATKEQSDLLDLFLPYNRAHARDLVARNALLNSYSPQALGISAPDDSRDWELYTEPELFNQLSSAYQQRLQRIYGRKGRVQTPASLKGAPRLTPEVAPPNTLVNNRTADATTQDTQSETFVLLGATNTVISAFNDSGSNVGGAAHFTGIARSTDVGNTWLDQGSLPNDANGDAGDPVIARNNTTGTIIIGTLGFVSGATIPTFRSTNDGVSYLSQVDADGGGTSNDKEWLYCDNNSGAGQGNFYLFYRDFGVGGGMSFTRSTDGGATWSARQIVASASGQGAAVTVGADHSVYAFWLATGNQLVFANQRIRGRHSVRRRRSQRSARPESMVISALTGDFERTRSCKLFHTPPIQTSCMPCGTTKGFHPAWIRRIYTFLKRAMVERTGVCPYRSTRTLAPTTTFSP